MTRPEKTHLGASSANDTKGCGQVSTCPERRDRCAHAPDDEALSERPTQEDAIDCSQRGFSLRVCHDIELLPFEWWGILVRKYREITISQNEVPARFYHARL